MRNKLRVEVFVPFGSCICDFATFMEKVGRVTAKFKDLIEIQMKSTKSPEASTYGVQDSCVMIGGKIKLSADFDEKELEDIITKWNVNEQ